MKYVVIGLIGLFVGVGAFWGGLNLGNQKVAYVDLNEVYNDFQLKKELESKLKNTQNQRKTILDSIRIQLNLLKAKVTSAPKPDEDFIRQFEYKRQEYLLKEKQFSEENDNLSQQYTDQIMKQMNQYVEDYGKSKNYDWIQGAKGDGGLMYVNKKFNITKEVLEYINSRYKGEK